MIVLKTISEKLTACRKYRGAVLELSQLTDHGHCQTKFYTACLDAGVRSRFTVFAHESPPRSARFEAENCLYLFALTVPAPGLPGIAREGVAEQCRVG
jgi:hypothetical protein